MQHPYPQTVRTLADATAVDRHPNIASRPQAQRCIIHAIGRCRLPMPMAAETAFRDPKKCRYCPISNSGKLLCPSNRSDPYLLYIPLFAQQVVQVHDNLLHLRNKSAKRLASRRGGDVTASRSIPAIFDLRQGYMGVLFPIWPNSLSCRESHEPAVFEACPSRAGQVETGQNAAAARSQNWHALLCCAAADPPS